jgi:hypothetical protein
MGLNLAHGIIATLSGDMHVLTQRPVPWIAVQRRPFSVWQISRHFATFRISYRLFKILSTPQKKFATLRRHRSNACGNQSLDSSGQRLPDYEPLHAVMVTHLRVITVLEAS